MYWELEDSISIHPSAEFISPGEDLTVYAVRDNCLVKFKKAKYKGGIASYGMNSTAS